MEWLREFAPDLLAFAISAGMVLAYYVFLWLKVRNNPTYTIHGVNEIARTLWVANVMANPGKDVMAVQTLRNIGMNVDAQNMDWASIGARRAKRDLPEAGGWNVYVTVAGGFDADSPITNAFLGAACGNSLPGWPCDQKLDELRTAWLQETDATKRKARLDAFQARAYEAVPYITVGQYTPAMAARASLKGTEKLWNGMPTVWALDK